jgi:hypothetical protein
VRWTARGGAVAGLADPGDLPGFFEQDLDRPAVGIAFDQLGGGGGQVGGDQGQVIAVGRAGLADQDDPHGPGAEHRIPQADQAVELDRARLAVAGHGRLLPDATGLGGEHDRLRQPRTFAAGPAPLPGPPRWRELVQGGIGA